MKKLLTATATALAVTLISGSVHAKEMTPVEIVSTLNLYSCKTPLTDSARALMNKHILNVDDKEVHANNDKLWPTIKKMGVGPWCRSMTKVIAAASRKQEE